MLGECVFTGETFCIVHIAEHLPKHANFPYGANHIINPITGEPAVKGKYWDSSRGASRVKRIYVHQTAGSYAPGFSGVKNTADFFVRDPEWTLNTAGKYVWTGRGRGWPGFAYTWYIPYQPELFNNLPVIYQTNPLSCVSWHTQGHNESSGGIAVQGMFYSRHNPRFRPFPGTDGRPSILQVSLLQQFFLTYAYPVLGLGPQDVFGHYHSGKLTCPGDVLEEQVELLRDAILRRPVKPTPDGYSLDTWKLRQAALVSLGMDLGTFGPNKNGIDGLPGELTRLAIESLEQSFELKVDGTWDEKFERQLLILLNEQGITQENIEGLV